MRRASRKSLMGYADGSKIGFAGESRLRTAGLAVDARAAPA
jgi:hypothetical protein